MNLIKKLLKYLVVIAVVLTAAAYLLPRNATVARSIQINASPDVIFPLMNSLQQVQKWSPWAVKDPDAVFTFSGPDAGVGSKLVWTSEHPDVGNGSEVIVESINNQFVASDLDFGDMGSARAEITLAAKGSGSLVTWNLIADMGNNPIGHYMGLMMDKWIGVDYEKGLKNLKAVAEGE